MKLTKVAMGDKLQYVCGDTGVYSSRLVRVVSRYHELANVRFRINRLLFNRLSDRMDRL